MGASLIPRATLLRATLVRATVLPATLFPVLLLGACASAGRLGEYDFRDRSLAAVTTTPPRPQVFTQDFWDPQDRSWLERALRVGSEIARDVQADKAQERIEAAAENVDVSALMADELLTGSARALRARPVESVREADFEIETRVEEYGIRADSWNSDADFFIKARVYLLDAATGREVWNAKVEARDPVNPSHWGTGGTLGTLITASALAHLSQSEMEEALRSLAQYSAGQVVEKLEEGLRKAGAR